MYSRTSDMKNMNEVLEDPRFSHIVKDARFKRLPKKHVKVKVDKRFQSMFRDEKFQIKSRVDKRGRPLGVRGSEDLKRYYDLTDSEEDEKSEEEEDVHGDSHANAADDDDDDDDYNDDDDGDYDKNIVDQSEDDNVKESGEESELSVGVSSPNQNMSKEQLDELRKSKLKKLKDYCCGETEFNLENEEILKTEDEKDETIKLKDQKGDKVMHKKKIEERKALPADIKKKLRSTKIDYARGEGKFMSDSSSEEEVTDDEVSDNEVHDWGELDNDAEKTEESTHRLAICHMDWDRIKAVDLMVLFHSFLPPGGLIKSITIYPSEFGMQRMKEEEEKGPAEFKELKTEKEEEDEKMDREQMEKLRKYQLNRLKYYYGIMECDSKETANTLYKECDGLEYECSAVKLDLRFVPDDTTFDQEPRDSCKELPDLSTYRPRLFQTTALTSSKVNLTWDENDPDREELVKALRSGNIDENQLNQYLAYSSSDDEDGENDKVLISDTVDEVNGKRETEQSIIDKYKALIADIEMKEKKKKTSNEVNLEVTWNLKLENEANKIVSEKIKKKDNLTPFEQYLDKRKEKKMKKKQERMAQINQSENGSDKSAFSDDELPSDVDLNDPYFKEELDKMKPKKTKKVKTVVEECEHEEDTRKKAELELLMLDDGSQDKHFSLKKIQESENADKKKKLKKGKKRKVEEAVERPDEFTIDLNDERFSALYSSHHYNIDPTDPHYRPTKATKELIDEKLKRRAMNKPIEGSRKSAENGKQKAELNVLVKNIKKNTAEMKKAHLC